jgi:hypothetical protein
MNEVLIACMQGGSLEQMHVGLFNLVLARRLCALLSLWPLPAFPYDPAAQGDPKHAEKPASNNQINYGLNSVKGGRIFFNQHM